MHSAASVPNLVLVDKLARTMGCKAHTAVKTAFLDSAILELEDLVLAGSGTLAKLFQYDLSYICAKFGAFR